MNRLHDILSAIFNFSFYKSDPKILIKKQREKMTSQEAKILWQYSSNITSQHIKQAKSYCKMAGNRCTLVCIERICFSKNHITNTPFQNYSYKSKTLNNYPRIVWTSYIRHQQHGSLHFSHLAAGGGDGGVGLGPGLELQIISALCQKWERSHIFF